MSASFSIGDSHVSGETFKGQIKTDPTKPDGTPRKLMDVGRLAKMGWRAQIGLEEGIAETYQWYLKNMNNLRG